MIACLLLLACGADPGPIRSTPSEPTVELAPPTEGLAQEVVWTDLGAFFPEAGPALPAGLSALVPGTNGAEARAVLDAARVPGVPIVAQPVGGHLVANTLLAGPESVGATLILDPDGAALQEIDLSLPTTAAEAALAGRWGPPTETVFEGEARVFRWRRDGAPWQAELRAVQDGKSVLKFRAP